MNTNEIKPPKVMPEPPDWLGEIALKEWNRVAPRLFNLGILTEIDQTALASYCQAYARWQECETAINQNGLTMQGRFGTTIRPEVTAGQKYAGIIKQFVAEFGLSPSARMRMVLPDDPDSRDDEGGLD